MKTKFNPGDTITWEIESKTIFKTKTIKMKKALEFLKKVFDKVKSWVVSTGIEGVIGLLAGCILWVIGYKIWAGFALGVFATRNWDILKVWMKKFLTK